VNRQPSCSPLGSRGLRSTKDPHPQRARDGKMLLAGIQNLRLMSLSEEYCDSLNNPHRANTIQEKHTGLAWIYEL